MAALSPWMSPNWKILPEMNIEVVGVKCIGTVCKSVVFYCRVHYAALTFSARPKSHFQFPMQCTQLSFIEKLTLLLRMYIAPCEIVTPGNRQIEKGNDTVHLIHRYQHTKKISTCK